VLIPETRFAAGEPEDEAQLGSLTRQAYQRLRDLIVTLQLPPGALLNDAALMAQLQVGRTPLREALQRLAGEGLVVVRPRRGAFVASLSLLDLQQIFELRRVIEGYAASLAAERASAADLEALQAALNPLAPAEAADPRALIEVDRAFHRALARAAHNSFLESTLSRMYNLNLRLWYLALDRIGPMDSAVREHQLVLDAIRRRDSAQAEAALRAHITNFQARIKAIL
jgi:DNA-binding GntR family transcriptional regulator